MSAILFLNRTDRRSFAEQLYAHVRRVPDLKLIATDEHRPSPLEAVADAFEVMPHSVAETAEWMVEVVNRHSITGVFAASNFDVELLEEVRPALERGGVRVAGANPHLCRVGLDKVELHRFLAASGLESPRTVPGDDAWRRGHAAFDGFNYPVIVKPERSQGSVRSVRVDNEDELLPALRQARPAIVQEVVRGEHFTVDFFGDADGRPHCIVPRVRVRTDGSRSIMGRVDMRKSVIDVVAAVAEGLRAKGLMNVQVITEPTGRVIVHDVNLRLASGVVLSIRAGAPYVKWLVEMLTTEMVPCDYQIENGLSMIRYYTEAYLRA